MGYCATPSSNQTFTKVVIFQTLQLGTKLERKCRLLEIYVPVFAYTQVKTTHQSKKIK